MEINIIPPESSLPLARAFVLNMVIKSFKGRKDVEIHLYRPQWDPSEEDAYNWDTVIQKSPGQAQNEMINSRQVILESFVLEERDSILDYLKSRYFQKLKVINSAPLPFPLPAGLTPLSMMPENNNYGRIRLERVPRYPLAFPVHGFYDLSAHSPILTGEEA